MFTHNAPFHDYGLLSSKVNLALHKSRLNFYSLGMAKVFIICILPKSREKLIVFLTDF